MVVPLEAVTGDPGADTDAAIALPRGQPDRGRNRQPRAGDRALEAAADPSPLFIRRGLIDHDAVLRPAADPDPRPDPSEMAAAAAARLSPDRMDDGTGLGRDRPGGLF